jgi:hypothetical protein
MRCAISRASDVMGLHEAALKSRLGEARVEHCESGPASNATGEIVKEAKVESHPAVKTDRRDARGIAQLMRMGWFRPTQDRPRAWRRSAADR